jgi:hypothetical protein
MVEEFGVPTELGQLGLFFFNFACALAPLFLVSANLGVVIPLAVTSSSSCGILLLIKPKERMLTEISWE